MKKNKHTYSEGVVEKSIIINLTSPESYQKKAEEIANEIGAYPNKSTVYYYHTKYSDELSLKEGIPTSDNSFSKTVAFPDVALNNITISLYVAFL